MQKTDHYKEINFHAGHRVTGGRVYAYFVSTMERLQLIVAMKPVLQKHISKTAGV
jgi:hypothetical protein